MDWSLVTVECRVNSKSSMGSGCIYIDITSASYRQITYVYVIHSYDDDEY